MNSSEFDTFEEKKVTFGDHVFIALYCGFYTATSH